MVGINGVHVETVDTKTWHVHWSTMSEKWIPDNNRKRFSSLDEAVEFAFKINPRYIFLDGVETSQDMYLMHLMSKED